MTTTIIQYILAIGLVVTCNGIAAQVGDIQFDPNGSVPVGIEFNNLAGKINSKLEDETIPEEDQYENPLYKPGLLYNHLNEPIGKSLMRYNMYADEMESSSSTSSSSKIIFYKKNLSKVVLENTHYYVLDYDNDEGKTTKGFFVAPLIDANCSIYMQQRKKLKPGKKAKDSYHADTKTTFVNTVKYYLKFKDNKPTPITLNKSKIEASFANHQQEIKNFIKEHKLKMKTEEDLIRLVTFYNNILPN